LIPTQFALHFFLRRQLDLLMKFLSKPLFLLYFLLTAGCSQDQQLLSVPVFARVEADPIGELSGIVKSPGRDNLYWVHNDSGDSARIFAITAEGKNILPTYSKFSFYGEEDERGKKQWQGFEVLDARNEDWEDIAVDSNYLYISDMGNNNNKRRDLGIYLVSEIDPTASTRTAVIQHLAIIYPDQESFPPQQKHFDSESLFTFDGKLYLITKHRAPNSDSAEPGAKLYRLDTMLPDQDNVLTLLESNADITSATGADVSPDGQTLAVISYNDLWLFDRPQSGDLWLSSTSRRYPLNTDVFEQVEAITWVDNATLLIANEQRDIFRLPLADLPSR